MRPADHNARDAARLKSARYRDSRDAAHAPIPRDEYEQRAAEAFRTRAGNAGVDTVSDADVDEPPVFHSTDETWETANSSIDRAIARGDFDNLAYAGKPLPSLNSQDPDWWVKSLMRRERVSGVGPPALLLRTEDAALDETLDALPSEAQVREAIADFNHRVVEARRQLLGGPPVITSTRDPDAEVRRWRGRRSAVGRPVPGETPAPGVATGHGPERSPGRWHRAWAWLMSETR